MFLLFIVTFQWCFKQAEANQGDVQSRHVVKPVNPKHTTSKWLDNMETQKPSPEAFVWLKNGTKPQPGYKPYFIFRFYHF